MTAILQSGRPPLVLASTSKTRARLLEAAGLSFTAQAPGLDEASMREAIAGEQTLDPHDVAEILARAKAEAVSDLAQDAYVVGGDQVLAFENQILSKPENMEAARTRLLDLNGKTHQLHTAVAIAIKGGTTWSYTDVATLTMRKLSPEFIGHYLAAAGENVLGAVGAYQIESLGIQLFEKIEGDFFSILGLPLLPLLDTLRREGVIES
jgi:nucleoside triphosphate pyrophosphatase